MGSLHSADIGEEMSLEQFVKDFEATLDSPERGAISELTKLSEISQFDSLAVLSVIAMMHKVYNTKIKGADIRKAVTVADLYDLIPKE